MNRAIHNFAENETKANLLHAWQECIIKIGDLCTCFHEEWPDYFSL
jgi:hypothetical protein